jgi:hypothetical protein
MYLIKIVVRYVFTCIINKKLIILHLTKSSFETQWHVKSRLSYKNY